MISASTGPAIACPAAPNSSAAMKRAASAMVMALSSAMVRPPSRTRSASGRSRAPPQALHGNAVWNFFTTKRLPTS